ncbi:transposase, partial [Lacticaseibacillus paracasei]
MVYRRKAVQLSIESFGSGLSIPLSPDNEWIQLADQVPWPQLEEAYQLSFPSNLGRAGKPFRLLYGAQLIKQRTQLSGRELVAAIRDTPAYQYSIGLPEYQPQAQGGQLNQRQTQRLTIIRKLYEQQTAMYRQHTHRVADRIISLDQPEIRPIIRGKAKDPVEFGPKIDVSISHGVVAVERFAFNAFNESADLPATIDHYFDTYGTYPDEILADTL